MAVSGPRESWCHATLCTRDARECIILRNPYVLYSTDSQIILDKFIYPNIWDSAKGWPNRQVLRDHVSWIQNLPINPRLRQNVLLLRILLCIKACSRILRGCHAVSSHSDKAVCSNYADTECFVQVPPEPCRHPTPITYSTPIMFVSVRRQAALMRNSKIRMFFP